MSLQENGVNLEEILAMIPPPVKQATPVINVTEDGLITVTVKQTAGKVAGGTRIAQRQIEVGGQTIEATKIYAGGSTSFYYSGLPKEPKAFVIHVNQQMSVSNGSGYNRVIAIVRFNGITIGIAGYSSAARIYSAAYFPYTYENGAITVSQKGFSSGYAPQYPAGIEYRLVCLL